MITLGGQVVLNEQHNTVNALDTSQYGPAFVAGVSQIQGQTLATGNEAGFWVTGTGSNTQIADWGDGSADSIAAAYDPDAQFHVHTHPGTSGPSYTDFLASALLGGMPGMVVSGSGNYAYGFQVEGGWLPAADGGVVVFRGASHDAQAGSGYNAPGSGSGGMDGVGHNHAGSTTVTTTLSGGATAGMGAEGSVTVTSVRNSRGEVVNTQVTTTGLVTAGVSPPGGNVSGQTTPGIQLNSPGFTPVAQLTLNTPVGTAQVSVNLSNLSASTASFELGTGKPSATFGVGAQHTTANGSMSYSGYDGNPMGLSTSRDVDHSGEIGGLW